MKKIGLLILVILGFAQVNTTEADYSKMSIKALDKALIEAVEKGSFDQVQELIAAGANVNEEIAITGSYGSGEGCMDYRDLHTLLEYAAIHGYVDILKELIKAGAVIHADHGQFTNWGLAALIGAAAAGHVDVVRELIKVGADVNHADRGHTALSVASRAGHVDMVRELIKAGAQVNFANNHGDTALIEASGAGRADVVRELIKAGAHVDHADTLWGDTALIKASKAGHGHVNVVRELVKAGAQVNITNEDGATALIEASCAGYVEVVRELIKAGAQVNITNKNGDTALMCAIKKHDFDVVQSLLQSPEFQTGIWQFIKDLFSDSAGTKPINYADKNGNTALILAIKNIQYRYVVGNNKQYNTCVNSQRIAEELLKFPGVDHYHVNKNGETAIILLEKIEKEQK